MCVCVLLFFNTWIICQSVWDACPWTIYFWSHWAKRKWAWAVTDLSGTRHCQGGEGRWSKKKKKAKNNLSMKKCGEMWPVEKHLSCDLKSFVFPWKTNSITVIKNINKGRADSWVSDKSTNHLLLIYCHMKFSQGDFFQYDTGIWNRWPQWKVLQIQPCLELCLFGEKADLFGVIAMPREISSVMLFPYWYLLLFAVAGNHWKHSRPAFTWYR